METKEAVTNETQEEKILNVLYELLSPKTFYTSFRGSFDISIRVKNDQLQIASINIYPDEYPIYEKVKTVDNHKD